jgi:cytoskeletal protein CcmA (bactofilin family)
MWSKISSPPRSDRAVPDDSPKEAQMAASDKAYSVTETPATPETRPGGAALPLLSVVGSTAQMQGRFDIAESIRIECEVGGELTVGKTLEIGPHGVVRADVRTVDAIIMGEYAGNMTATGNVEITATGRVTGNIETDSLVIAKGGFFNGSVVKLAAERQPDAASRPVYLMEEKRARVLR